MGVPFLGGEMCLFHRWSFWRFIEVLNQGTCDRLESICLKCGKPKYMVVPANMFWENSLKIE